MVLAVVENKLREIPVTVKTDNLSFLLNLERCFAANW
jgi:hypothetical protein